MTDEAVDEISQLVYEHNSSESEDMSDDVGMQLLHDAIQICNHHDVSEDNRIEVIVQGYRTGYYKTVDDRMEQMKWHLSLMSGL